MNDIKGKVVAVTGSNRGIGRDVAAYFAELGAKVAVTARSLEAAQKASEEIGGAGAFALDVTDPDSVAAAVKAIMAEFGQIDVWVNNAGITRDNLALRMKSDDWDAVIASNLTGAFTCCKAVLRPMMKARSGSVINISSVVGAAGNPGQPNYCAAKAGMEGMTRSLALEYAGKNLRFNCVAPGFIATDMTDELTDAQKDAMTERIPLARLGAGRDIAQAVAFLASESASYITGQVLHVNGGMYLN